MTATGHKAVADAIEEQIKRRKQVERTVEVREEKLPADVVDTLDAMAKAVLDLQARLRYVETHAIADIRIVDKKVTG